MNGTYRIRWAPMLPTHKLVRLYENDAAGMLDDDLVDDVGWRLWERLSDVIRVTSGRVRCAACGTEFQVRAANRRDDQDVGCPDCRWTVTPYAWHKSWENRDLNGRCEEFDQFVKQWPVARALGQKMILIDMVVHALHVSTRSDAPGNFAARNFLEGSRPKIVALLDELAHGPGSHVAERARASWDEARHQYRTRRPGSSKER